MMRSFLVAFAVLIGLTAGAAAQGCGQANPNCVVPTAPFGTNNNQGASTAFVQAAISNLTTSCTVTTNPVKQCSNVLQNSPGGTVATSFNYNQFAVVESLAAGSNTKLGWSFIYDSNGSSGFVQAVASTLTLTASPPGAYQYNALQASTFTAVPGANSTIFAFNPQIVMSSGATGYAGASVNETDILVSSGASVAYLIGTSIVQLTGHGNHGATKEAALVFSNQSSTIGWNNLIYIGTFNPGSITPMTATGTIMVVDATVTAAHGIDFSAATFTADAFKSSGFSVNGSGIVTAAGIISASLVNQGSGVQLGNGADTVTVNGTGGLAQVGSSSGKISFLTQAAAGTYNWNWPTTAGTATYLLTSQGGASTAMTWTNPTVTVNSVACTIGSSCTISAVANLVSGTTTITGACTNGFVLYNNAGVLGCQSIAGGGNVSNTGTPTNGQIAQWTNSTTIQGISTVGVANGGTGQSTLTANAFLVGNGTTAISQIALTGLVLGNGVSAPTSYAGASCTNQVINALSASGGATCVSLTNSYLTAGTFSSITGVGTLTAGATGSGFTVALATSTITGQLGVANGGTGDATLTSNGVLYGNGTSAVQATAQGGANTILTANAGAPSWSASPTIGISLTVPQVYGGTAANASLFFTSTSNGSPSGDFIDFLGSQIFFQNVPRTLTWMTLGPTLGQMFVTGLASATGVAMCFNTSSNQIGQCSSITSATTINTGVAGIVLTLQNSAGTCTHTPTAGSETVSCSSDERLKANIHDAPDTLPDLMTYRIREYDVRADGSLQIGTIAQEMAIDHAGMVRADRGGFFAVDQINPWKLVKAIQELKADNDNLRAEIETLKTGTRN